MFRSCLPPRSDGWTSDINYSNAAALIFIASISMALLTASTAASRENGSQLKVVKRSLLLTQKGKVRTEAQSTRNSRLFGNEDPASELLEKLSGFVLGL